MSPAVETLFRWQAVRALLEDGPQHDWAVEALLAAGVEAQRRLVPLLRGGQRADVVAAVADALAEGALSA